MSRKPLTPLTILIWCCVGLALAGFVSPWVNVELIKETELERSLTRAAKRTFSKGLTRSGSRENFWTKKARKSTALIPTRVSGIQIPGLANRQQTRVLLGLAQAFTKEQQAKELGQLGWKSYAVWLVPGLALVFGMLLATFGDQRRVAVVIGLVCAAIAAIGAFQLLSVDTRKAYGIAIGSGIWMSLGAYAGLAWAAAVPLLPASQTVWWNRRLG